MTIALWCVLIAAIMPVLTVGIAKWGPALDNNHPRDWAGTLQGYRRRAYAAHQNAYEAFPFFAAAVLAALIREPSGGIASVDTLALVFVAARVAYTAAYVTDRATIRSVFWGIGWFATIGILLSAIFA